MDLLSKIRRSILDFLFPIECLACGRAKHYLCQDCLMKLNFLSRQSCLFCNRTSPAGQSCPDCRKYHALDGAFIAGNYQDPLLAELIKKFKFSGLKSLAEPLGAFLVAALSHDEGDWPEFLEKVIPRAIRHNPLKNFLASQPLLVPIPISAKRRAYRGYNQSELIASALLKDMPSLNYSDALKKIRHTPAQSSLQASRRFDNLEASFVWKGKSLTGLGVLLLDDIATTGATLEEAAKTLKRAGALKVWGLALAKG